jgi:hypothetical protein
MRENQRKTTWRRFKFKQTATREKMGKGMSHTVKRWIFPSSAGMSPTKLSLTGILAGDGKIDNLF